MLIVEIQELLRVLWEGNQCVDRLARIGSSWSDMAFQVWDSPPPGPTPLLLADRMEIASFVRE